MKIVEDRLVVTLNDVGGKLSGHSYKKGLWVEEYDFDIEFDKGGIRMLVLEFKLDKWYVNRHEMPYMYLYKSGFAFDDSKFGIFLHTEDKFLTWTNRVLRVYKSAVLDCMLPFLNSDIFKGVVNNQIKYMLSMSKGEMHLGPI